jgi:transcription elongation factor GreA
MATIPLTRRGADKLKEELARLKSVERHAVIQAISEARAQGDLSENAEYEAAKDKQGFIEAASSRSRASSPPRRSSIRRRSTPRAGSCSARPSTSRKRKRRQGHLPDRRRRRGRPEAGPVSISSPIARALIGKTAGDVAEVQAPAARRATRSWPSATREGASARPRRRLAGGRVGGRDARHRRHRRADLFQLLPRAEAGRIAGRLFSLEATAGVCIGAVLVLVGPAARTRSGRTRPRLALRRRARPGAGAVGCIVAGHYALLPMLEAARAGQGSLSFGALHALSRVLRASAGTRGRAGLAPHGTAPA